MSSLRSEIDLVIVSPSRSELLVRHDGQLLTLPKLATRSAGPFGINAYQSIADAILREFGIDCEVVSLTIDPSPSQDRRIFARAAASELGTVAELDKGGLRWRHVDTVVPSLDYQSSLIAKASLDTVELASLGDRLAEFWDQGATDTIRFLDSRMSTDGQHVGWTQLLTGNNVGALSTAQGLLSYSHANNPGRLLHPAIDTLRAFQNPDGGWPVRKALIGVSQRSIVESTLFCIWALGSVGVPTDDQVVAHALEYIESAQREDGGWGSTESSDRSRVYPTAFAIRILSEVASKDALKKGIAWLRGSQNPDGGWGTLSAQDSDTGHSSTAAHTAHALLALATVGGSQHHDEIEKATSHLLETLRLTDSSPWPSSTEVESVDDDASLDFRHSAPPWVLASLVASGTALASPPCLQAIRWLLTTRHSLGYWTTELTPGQTPLWATHDALYSLSVVKRHTAQTAGKYLLGDVRAAEANEAWSQALAVQYESTTTRHPYFLYAWNGVLTGLVVLAILFSSDAVAPDWSAPSKLFGSIGVGIVSGFAPFIYGLLAQEISNRRGPSDVAQR